MSPNSAHDGAPVGADTPDSTDTAGSVDGGVSVDAGPGPLRISGRKILDRDGRVFLMRTFSSWAMAMNLSDAEITQALEGIKARGFNAVTVAIGGGIDMGDWHRYTNKAGQSFWTGKPWQSRLGPAWSSVDWVVAETSRLGMIANLSLFTSWDTSGIAPDLNAATDAQLYSVGAEVAARYQGEPNIVWHVMFDTPTTVEDPTGQRVDAYFHGINDTEGAAARPVRWAEPRQGVSVVGQLGGFSHFNLTTNGFYKYVGNSTEAVEASWNETCATAIPTGDTEPLYDGHNKVGGDQGFNLRYRSWAIFLEGGVYENYGHEDWWTFGSRNGVVGEEEGLTWQQVPDHIHTVQQSYIWSFLDKYVADLDWQPSTWVTDGEGSGDNKAAVGASPTALVAYFPTSREITVDTTPIAGSGSVRLRWYDPTEGTFTVLSEAEAQASARTVVYPADHADGTADWVLVVDGLD